jgi:hypothetical protein
MFDCLSVLLASQEYLCFSNLLTNQTTNPLCWYKSDALFKTVCLDFQPVNGYPKSMFREDIVWDIDLCSLVKTDRRFRDAYCLRHQGDE